ncbi:IS66 family transposase [Kiloniella sp.]|uniref:IS66 family transposase n=1 Tax=Kiloniella sp. TaxID=1938587 RepID=UPI003B0155B5
MSKAHSNLLESNEELRVLNRGLHARIDILEEQNRLLRHQQFAPSSEKSVPEQQGHLFDEAEETAEDGTETEDDIGEIAVPAHTRKKGGRRSLSEDLPRVRIEHDIPEEQKLCACGCGLMSRIGEEVTEQLDIIPAKIQVLQHVRFKYACKSCEEGVTIAPLPPQPIPKSIASPGLLAYIVTGKYVDGLPLYRMVPVLNRSGIEFNRTLLSRWVIKCGDLVQPLINLFTDHLLNYDIIAMDETGVQVLKEPGKKPQSKSYMWGQKGGPPDQPVILFHYDPSRGEHVAKGLLEDYTGYLVSDGYQVYLNVTSDSTIVGVGCMAHVRRKFNDVIKALEKSKKRKPGLADHAMKAIRSLYRIEKLAKDMSNHERQRLREEKAKPILEDLREWITKVISTTPPTSLLGKALHYIDKQWPRLIRYLDDGRLPIDNNEMERVIKPFVIGRKNWLFSNSQNGAKASANLYGIVETAKANGIEPYSYLRHIFTELPKAQTVEDFEALLPWNVDRNNVTPFIRQKNL